MRSYLIFFLNAQSVRSGGLTGRNKIRPEGTCWEFVGKREEPNSATAGKERDKQIGDWEETNPIQCCDRLDGIVRATEADFQVSEAGG